jgi:ribosome-associated translation inhibitor RaiA/DNA-directed RNA polymerase specialized sigma24 family protein
MAEKSSNRGGPTIMQLAMTYLGLPPEAHEGIRESIESWAQRQIEPLLSFLGPLRLVATVKRQPKGEARYSVTLRVHLPRRHILVAQGENVDVRAAISQAEERLLREVKKYKDRLQNQAENRRRARRARLHSLEGARSALSAEVVAEARADIERLLPRLERVARRELAYLRDIGELPSDYPTVHDVVDETLSAVIPGRQPGDSEDTLFQQLLRELFRTLDAETAMRRRYGEPVSLDASPAPNAQEQVEEMVEEEIYEFYQPDDVVRLVDMLADEAAMQPEAALETAQREYSQIVSRGLPTEWRRVWMLAELEQLMPSDIAVILDLEFGRVEHLLTQTQEFLRDHLRQAGFWSPP